LKNNFLAYYYILFFKAVIYSPLIKLHSPHISTDKRVSVEILEKIPANNYLVSKSDSFQIIISRYLEIFSDSIINCEGTIQFTKLVRVFVSGLSINKLNLLFREFSQIMFL